MTKEQVLIIASFAAIYFIWGSTYLANDWAMGTIPPLIMAGSRFLVAGCILYPIAAWSIKERPKLRQIRNAGIIGFLFLTIGTGAAILALQYVDTSFAALVIAFEPMVIMLMLWGFRGKLPSWLAWVGAAVSIVGLLLLIGQPELPAWEQLLPGLGWIATGMLSWGVATVYLDSVDMGENSWMATAWQMLLGGGMLILLSLLKSEWVGWSPVQVDSRSLWSWIYLVFFGSILAFSAFNYLLKRVSPEKVATNTYVNPLVAAALGYYLNDEPFSEQTAMAAVIMLAGVYFINKAK